MKNLRALLGFYLVVLVTFVIQKPLFLLYHWQLSAAEGFEECMRAVWHGLPMDLSTAGYLTALPALVLWASACFPIKAKITGRILRVYSVLASLLVALIFIPDLELYSYWGFRIDATVLNYLLYPKEAAASVPGWVVGAVAVAVVAWAAVLYWSLNRFVIRPFLRTIQFRSRSVGEMVIFPLAVAGMFLLMRGSVGTSTMNVSKVYFSRSMYLNHAAINPCFNMLASMGKERDFDKQYRFMDDAGAQRLFGEMMAHIETDSLPALLNTQRPNIVFLILESFGNQVLDMPEVTPNLNALAGEGVLFSGMYANSFRTDRGLTAILSGYPAQPTMSIIKYPEKAQNLPSLPAALRRAGYNSQSFFYGGDVNFAGIKSYIVSQGITDITSDHDFPVSELLNKWGAPDHVTFPRFLKTLEGHAETPYFKVFLTLSSHEPFDVPVRKFEDPYLNSVWYTDNCLGEFIAALKQTPAWNNMLLVLLPDHNMRWPADVPAHSPQRHDIFALWTGGAVKDTLRIETLCTQSDLAATLLGQLGEEYDDFTFSRNILNPSYPQYAFYDFPDGFGLVSPAGTVVWDHAAKTPLVTEGHNPDSLLMMGKAFLQILYDDIEKR